VSGNNLPLSRIEASTAEIMRLHRPTIKASMDAMDVWYDIMEHFAAIFAIGKSRFNVFAFVALCEGDWISTEERELWPTDEEIEEIEANLSGV
jgi:hypothetical protein